MASTVTKNSFKLFPFLMLVIVNTSIISTSNTSNPVQIAFSIDLQTLNPNEHSAIPRIAGLLSENLPKIGVGINIVEHTTSDNIAERTWNYPIGRDYDYIPTYAEGGYDIVLREVVWDFDHDHEGYFDSESIVPNGLNYYQYNNIIYDNYLNFFLNQTYYDGYEYLFELVTILYDELPSIAICYPRTVFSLKNTVSGIDWTLLTVNQHRIENWRNSDGHMINYGFREKLSGTNIF
ncbi:MAG: hypothetical protein KAS52_08450, partial [Candidatus Heimdallarchaeota archaeon]|nr:hypothetical protein [Candidatus Heimdallarchaeota archaeon]